MNHNQYEYLTNSRTGIIELVWVDAEAETSEVLCEIDATHFDHEDAMEHTSLNYVNMTAYFDARGYFSQADIDVSELVEYAHTHGLIEFDLRRELENMGFCDMGGSTRMRMLECRGTQIWIEPEMLVFVAVKTAAIGMNLDIPNTYADFQPIRDKILELIATQPQPIGK